VARAAFRLLVVWLALACASVAALAFDDATLTAAQDRAAGIKTQLDGIQAVIADSVSSDDQLSAQRALIERLREQAGSEAQKLTEPLSDVQQQLARLGPPPADGQAEAEPISSERANLSGQASNIQAAVKRFELLQLDADQTLQRLLAKQRALFLQRIFKADRTVLNPQLWLDYASGMRILSWRLSGTWNSLSNIQLSAINIPGLVLIPLGLVVILLARRYFLPLISSWAGYANGHLPEGQVEPALLRLWRVVWGCLSFTIAIVFLAIVVTTAVESSNLLSDLGSSVFRAMVSALVDTAIYGRIAYLISQPGNPSRRLIAVDSQSARTLTTLVIVGAAAYAISNELIALAEKMFLPVGFVIGQSAVAVLLMVTLLGLILSVIRRQASEDHGGEQPFFLVWFLRLMPLLWILLAVSLVALFLGYIAFAYFIVGNLFDTALLVVVLGVLHAFFQAFAESVARPETKVGRLLRQVTGLAEDGVGRLVLTFRTIADVVIILIAVPSLIAMWTVTLLDLSTMFGAMMRGFTVGNIVISPSMIALALLVLAIGVVLTRVFTSWLQNRILRETRLDKGVQVSLRTSAGYVGYTLAAALALSAAGLDFSTLAIVAGALGVGIGFGLQSIVNNFVSGLILLAERPVRVGDWIVTPGAEGIVRNINVRATEIETFDGSSIIIPNQTLITNPVRNWTLRDTMGRFSVNVGFVHGVDTAQVVSTLEKLASSHPKVMRHPPPKVVLSKIAPNGLQFDLSGQVADVLEAASVASDLRLAIVGSFDKKLLECAENTIQHEQQ